MNVVIQKVGNSNMITLPRPLMKRMGWSTGDAVIIQQSNKDSLLVEVKDEKPLEFIGKLHIPDFDLEQTQNDIKTAAYKRNEISNLR